MAPPQQQSRKASIIGLRGFVCAAVLSELLVLRHLWKRWPSFVHPLEPPISPNISPFLHAQQRSGSQDGTFNGVPLVYVQDASKLHSSIHCVGENFEQNAWMFRSCHFRNLCLDLNAQELVLVRSTREQKIHETWMQSNKDFVTMSSVMSQDKAVALGILHPSVKSTKIGDLDQQYANLKWFPNILEQEELSSFSDGYYELPADIVLVPFNAQFHATEMTGPMQPVWDVAFPIFTLLSAFGLTNGGKKPLLIQHDESAERQQVSFDNILPFMGLAHGSVTTIQDVQLKGIQISQSRLVCAQEAAAGIGMISDRGFHLPSRGRPVNIGLSTSTAQTTGMVRNVVTNNVAQGAILNEFRSFALRNLGVPSEPFSTNAPGTIVFYAEALQRMAEVTQALSDQSIELPAGTKFDSLDPLELSTTGSGKSIQKTTNSISKSSVLVTVCCQADVALAATFLPLGSSLVLLYDDEKYGDKLSKTRRAHPALQRDWDLISNAGYFSVHWLPFREGAFPTMSLVEVLARELGG